VQRDPLDRQRRDERDDPAARPGPLEPAEQAPAARGREPEQQRDGRHAVEEQVRDEPQVVPAEAARGIRLKLEHRRIELQVAAGEGAAGDPLDVDLRRHDHEHAEHQRHQQPLDPIDGEPADRSALQRDRRGDAGDHHQQRHPHRVQERHRLLEDRQRFRVLEVEVPAIEHHPDVKHVEDHNRDHA
jgi:hypothetical protein